MTDTLIAETDGAVADLMVVRNSDGLQVADIDRLDAAISSLQRARDRRQRLRPNERDQGNRSANNTERASNT